MASRLVDNPAPEVDSRLMQHSTVLCFRFQLERRLKLWLKQGGCGKSKRHFFYRGFKGALFKHWAFGPLFATILISGTSPGLVQPLIALRLRAFTPPVIQIGRAHV